MVPLSLLCLAAQMVVADLEAAKFPPNVTMVDRSVSQSRFMMASASMDHPSSELLGQNIALLFKEPAAPPPPEARSAEQLPSETVTTIPLSRKSVPSVEPAELPDLNRRESIVKEPSPSESISDVTVGVEPPPPEPLSSEHLLTENVDLLDVVETESTSSADKPTQKRVIQSIRRAEEAPRKTARELLVKTASETAAKQPPAQRLADSGKSVLVPKGVGPGFETERDRQGARIILHWDKPVNVTPEFNGREVLLRFDRPMVVRDLSSMIKALNGWLEDVRYGYDAILIRAIRPDILLDVSANGRQTVIEMRIPEEKEAAQIEQEKAEARRLEFLTARLTKDSGGIFPGRAQVSKVLAKAPKTVEYLQDLGTQERDLGRWRSGLALYNRALAQAPGEPNIIFAKSSLSELHGRSFEAGYTGQGISLNDEDRGTYYVSGAYPMDRNGEVGFDWSWNESRSNSQQRAGGDLQQLDFKGGKGQVYYGFDHGDTSASTMRVFMNDGGVVGAGYDYDIDLLDLEVTASGRYREPYWGLLSGIADEGVRDRMELNMRQPLGWGWYGTVAGSYNRYGVKGYDFAASASEFLMSLRYDLLGPDLTANYQISQEHVITKKQATNSAGARFFPMPLTGRNTHTASLAWSSLLTDYLRGGALFQYAHDFKGETGKPSATFNMLYKPLAELEAEAFYQYEHTYQDGVDSVLNLFGSRIKYVY
ncbi:MAG: hypothetical protein HQL53_01430 [Magnetococcales bacterium]|nr:hypothetical protein [Magnetococcales bacterium]